MLPIDDIKKQVQSRMKELKPLVEEYKRLLIAEQALMTVDKKSKPKKGKKKS